MRPNRWPLTASIIGVLAQLPAHAGVILGTVHVPPPSSKPSGAFVAYPGRAGTMPGMHDAPHGMVTDAVVYVAKAPAAADSALPASTERPRLSQHDQSFVPRVLPVAVGTAVDFPNLDPIYHNVFSLSPVKRFDLGKYPRGHSKTVVFNRVGLVNVYCDIHSDMAAFVLVLPHRAFAQPGADGFYALPDLPPGKYELHAWHPDLPEIVRPVEITGAPSVRVDLSF